MNHDALASKGPYGSEEVGSARPGEVPYEFRFDKARDTWVCSIHGDVDSTAWVRCWNGCDEGWFDDYEEDPIECEPGEISRCSECKGEGGWRVCGECNADNPDAEW